MNGAHSRVTTSTGALPSAPKHARLDTKERPLNPPFSPRTVLPTDWKDIREDQLIAHAKEGNAEAFGAIYERHAEAVYRFLFAHLGNHQDAEDLTGEVFLKTWRALPSYQDQGMPFLALLFRVARNRLIDYYRSSDHARSQVSIDLVPVRDRNPEPGEQVSRALEEAELRLKLDQLREDYRLVLMLRFLSGLSPEETAQVMGRSVGAVRVLQHRALSALRDILGWSQG